MCSTSTGSINKILSTVFFVVLFAANAYGTDGYIFPDYHRLLVNGKAIAMNLGMYRDGTLFLKFDESEYPLHDPDAFKRGTEQAMEYTQVLQHGGENSRNFFKSTSDEPALLLYDSASLQGNGKSNHFTLVFDHHNTAGQYPIKIIFSNSTLQRQSYDFPPGELQYLQKKIDMILENKKNDLSKAR
jgi:hypothetical protein